MHSAPRPRTRSVRLKKRERVGVRVLRPELGARAELMILNSVTWRDHFVSRCRSPAAYPDLQETAHSVIPTGGCPEPPLRRPERSERGPRRQRVERGFSSSSLRSPSCHPERSLRSRRISRGIPSPRDFHPRNRKFHHDDTKVRNPDPRNSEPSRSRPDRGGAHSSGAKRERASIQRSRSDRD